MKKLHDMIILHTEYCPHCRAVANLTESIFPRIVIKPDGDTEMIVSKTYHCASCHSFVRSEEDELQGLDN